MARYFKIFRFSLLLTAGFLSGNQAAETVDIHTVPSADGYRVNVRTFGDNHQLHLKRPSDSILSENIHVLNVDVDVDGKTVIKKWIPTEAETASSNHVYVDEQKKAVFQVAVDRNSSEIKLNGVFSDMTLYHDGSSHIMNAMDAYQTDYIDLKRNISGSGRTTAMQSTINVVEMVIVCDKEFGDLFQHNNHRILDYFTVYMWDLNLRYKTLPSDNISFRINGIVVIQSLAAQPFIEEARAPDGRAEFGRILNKYASWVYTQRNLMPKHDLAPLVTNTKLEWGGGLAWMNAACWVDINSGMDLGTAVFNDNGGWGSVTVATHELAHNLGAPHDDDPNFPGGCDQRGFIMGGGNDEKRYFFSSCSDRLISQFVRSGSASCLRRIDQGGNPVIDPSYSNPKAPTMEYMCQLVLNIDTAYVEEADKYNCKTIKCRWPGGNGWTYSRDIAPVENINCGEDGIARRCFRGVCQKPGYIFTNQGSGLCMIASNPFAFTALATMIVCPSDGTPLERFVISSSDNGFNLGTPFTSNRNEESGYKCLYTGNGEGGAISTDRCNAGNPWHGWDLIDDGINYMLSHRVTRRCAKPRSREVGSYVETVSNCDINNPDFLWRLYS